MTKQIGRAPVRSEREKGIKRTAELISKTILLSPEGIAEAIYDRFYEPIIQQAKAEVAREIKPLVDKLFESLDHADFSNGIEAHGVDEGRVRANQHIGELGREWGGFKSKYVEGK